MPRREDFDYTSDGYDVFATLRADEKASVRSAASGNWVPESAVLIMGADY